MKHIHHIITIYLLTFSALFSAPVAVAPDGSGISNPGFRAGVLNGSGVSEEELSYVGNLTADAQAQINGKVSTSDVSTTGGVSKIPKTGTDGKLTLSGGTQPGLLTSNGRFTSSLELYNVPEDVPIFTADPDFVTIRQSNGLTVFTSEEFRLYDATGTESIDFGGGRALHDETGQISIGWNTRELFDGVGMAALEWSQADNVQLPEQNSTHPNAIVTNSLGDQRFGRKQKYVRTSAAHTISSNASLTDVNGLTVTLTETGIYRFEGFCGVSPSNSTMGVKVALAITGGGGSISGYNQFTNNNVVSGVVAYHNNAIGSLEDMRQIVGGTNGQPVQSYHSAMMNVTSAPVTVKYRFAQHTSNASSLTADIGNWIVLTPIQ